MVQRISRKILDTPIEPPSTSWLWLHEVNGVPSLDWYLNGKWTPISRGSSIQPLPKENYVTPTALQVRLQDYLKKTELGQSIQNYVGGLNLASKSYVTGQLAGYQPKLTAGTGISLLGNTISVNLNAGTGISINGNTISLSGTSSGSPAYDDSALIQRITSLESAVDTLQSAGYIPGSWFKTINGNDLFSNAPTSDNIVITGGSGTGAGIHIAEQDEETNDAGTLYFFTHSPWQGVGLYSTLLQKGRLNANETADGNVYVYHPSKFYHLYEDGSFDELPEIEGVRYADCNPNGNSVYYNYYDNKGNKQRVLTDLQFYGDVVVSHKILYAETSDTAYFALQVKGPFFAENTDVTFTFNDQDIEVKVASNNSGNITYTELSDSDYIRFTYDDFSVTRFILFKRKYSDINELKTAKDVVVTLNNGYSSTDITVKYGSCQVFYKDGNTHPMSGITGFTPTSGTTVQTNNSWNYFKVKLLNTGKLKFAENVKIDQTKYNIIYAKVVNAPGDYSVWLGYSNRLKVAATRYDTVNGNSKGWTTATAPSNNYAKTSEGYGHNDCDIEYPLWGSSAITCRIKEVRPYFRHPVNSSEYDANNPDMLTLKELLLYKQVSKGDWYNISELGVITHNDPFDNDN